MSYENESVFLLNAHDRKPVFHVDGVVHRTEQGSFWLTHCGRAWGHLHGTSYWQATILPRRHAEKFARECSVCAKKEPS